MDTLFFVAAKLVWALIRPDTVILLLLGGGALALWRSLTRLGGWLSGAGLALFLGIGVLPIADALLAPLEARYPPEPAISDPVVGILVLGGAEDPSAASRWGQPASNDAAERFLVAITVARDHPEAQVLLTGGSAALTGQTGALVEAEIAARFLTDAGVAPARILREERSRNTAENASLSLALIKSEGLSIDGPWILVTSAFHMPRAVETFCAAGWRGLVPWPVDYRSGRSAFLSWDFAEHLRLLTLAAKEWVGRIAYRATGRARAPEVGCLVSGPT